MRLYSHTEHYIAIVTDYHKISTLSIFTGEIFRNDVCFWFLAIQTDSQFSIIQFQFLKDNIQRSIYDVIDRA